MQPLIITLGALLLAAAAFVLWRSHAARLRRQRTLKRMLDLADEVEALLDRSQARMASLKPLVQRVPADIAAEAQEDALPEGMEPLLVGESAEIRPIDLVEDELILALPVVPMNPESTLPDAVRVPDEDNEVKPNPFSALAALKDHKK